MVTAVHGLLTQLGIERASLAGNSMGGNTAWRFALAHPERVERLVLIDASGYPGNPGVGPRSENAVTRVLYRYGNPTPLIRSGFRDAVEDKAIVTEDRVQRWVSYIRRQGSRDAHRKRAEQRAVNDQPFARMTDVRAPTLILWGEKDALVPVAHAARFDQDIKDSRAIVYKGIGHMPQLEIPERSANDAREFLLSQ
jgi:pimeloyl-ACP methyl ester carboxylesterase